MRANAPYLTGSGRLTPTLWSFVAQAGAGPEIVSCSLMPRSAAEAWSASIAEKS